jgi:hypothetical protein
MRQHPPFHDLILEYLIHGQVASIHAYGDFDVNGFFWTQELLSLEKILKKHLNELAHKGLRKLLLCGSLVSPSICRIKNSKKQQFY